MAFRQPLQRRNLSLVFFRFDTKMQGCMPTMPIDNSLLSQRSLQFIGISVHKVTFKSIKLNIIQSSNNYNMVCLFNCWNKNILYMKILDISHKTIKRDLGFGGKI